MELTKEECLKAYNELHTYEYELFGNQDMTNSNVFFELIKEHFDNPPLKLEQLKEEMVVWYKKEKDYIKIFVLDDNSFSYTVFGSEQICGCVFEEGCLYLREVKE